MGHREGAHRPPRLLVFRGLGFDPPNLIEHDADRRDRIAIVPPDEHHGGAPVGRPRRAACSAAVSSRGTSGAAPQRRRSRGRSAWRSPARVPRCAFRQSYSRAGAFETAAIDGGAQRRRVAGRRSRRGSPERAGARPAGAAAGRQRAGVVDPAGGGAGAGAHSVRAASASTARRSRNSSVSSASRRCRVASDLPSGTGANEQPAGR